MEKRYYIAYGSNLNVQQMFLRCPTARIVGTSEIKDHRLMFKGSNTGAYLTIEPARGHKVPVAIWSVTPDDEAALDVYEGYPNCYYKADMNLDVKKLGTDKHITLTGFVYIMHEQRPLGRPTIFYMDTCMNGYERFDFDQKFLVEAYRFSTKGAKK